MNSKPMNDTQIETILRNAPRPRVPAGLREKLEADIVLPKANPQAAITTDARPWLRRWLPTLSFSALLLACLVAIAVQSNVLSEFRRANQQFQASIGDVEQLRRDNAEYQTLQTELATLDQLRKDNVELQKLRDEVTSLRQQLQDLPALRAENQRLLAQKAATATTAVSEEEDPFGAAKEKARRIQCVSNLKQVCLAARMWANDHKEVLPSDFLTMKNELNSPKILVCPADNTRTRVSSWADFAESSYTILSPGASPTRPEIVYVTCPLHNNVGMVDGSVSQLNVQQHQVVQDAEGKWIVQKKQ